MEKTAARLTITRRNNRALVAEPGLVSASVAATAAASLVNSLGFVAGMAAQYGMVMVSACRLCLGQFAGNHLGQDRATALNIGQRGVAITDH